MDTRTNTLDIDTAMPGARFTEYHHRDVDLPIEQVWPALLAVTVGDIRTLGPLMKLRSLPRRLRRRPGIEPAEQAPLLDAFTKEGFVVLRRDPAPVDGRASVLFGAAGRFWSPTANRPIAFDTPEGFLAFDAPGHAKTVARLDAIRLDDRRTRIETETRVIGTDPQSSRRFGAYWLLIRLPSGLIRRSWLAAIERRARR